MGEQLSHSQDSSPEPVQKNPRAFKDFDRARRGLAESITHVEVTDPANPQAIVTDEQRPSGWDMVTERADI